VNNNQQTEKRKVLKGLHYGQKAVYPVSHAIFASVFANYHTAVSHFAHYSLPRSPASPA